MRYKMAIVFTMLLWVLMALLTIWIFISVIWWALSAFVYTDLFIPQTIKTSIYIYGILLSWICFALLFFKVREKRIFSAPNTKNLNALSPVTNNNKPDFIEITDSDDKQFSNFLESEYLMKNTAALAPAQLLSYAVNILSKGCFVRALSILRKIVNDENAPTIIRYSAHYYMLSIISADKNLLTQRGKKYVS